MKKCTKCGIEKGSEFFCFDKRHKDGLQSQCKACMNKSTKKLNKTKKRIEYNKKYQKEYCRSMEGKKSYSKFWKSIKGKITRAKTIAKRSRELGFILINSYFPACNFHHLNETYVLAIPGSLHNRYRHNHKKLETMELINSAAVKWYYSLT